MEGQVASHSPHKTCLELHSKSDRKMALHSLYGVIEVSRSLKMQKFILKKDVIYIPHLVCAPISDGVHANTFSLAETEEDFGLKKKERVKNNSF